MTKIHTIADESLGGVLREYVEVEGRPNVGDYVYIKDCEEIPEINKQIGKCTCNTQFYDGSIDVGIPSEIYGEISFLDGVSDEFYTLEPTDIVQVDGKRYRMVERKAEVGEKVIIVNENDLNRDGYKNGHVFTVSNNTKRFPNLVGTSDAVTLFDCEYVVLEPVKTSTARTLAVDITANTEVVDLIANLARRVSSLESQLRDTQGNVERQGVEIAEINDWLQSPSPWAEQSDIIEINKTVTQLFEQTESNTKDIVQLDERLIELEPRKADIEINGNGIFVDGVQLNEYTADSLARKYGWKRV